MEYDLINIPNNDIVLPDSEDEESDVDSEFVKDIDINSVQSILQLFHKKKQELDDEYATEEEVQNKLSQLKIDTKFDEFFAEMKWTNSFVLMKRKKSTLFHFEQLDIETGKLKTKLGEVDVDKEMKKSVLQPGIEKEQRLPPYQITKKRLKALRKKEREKTKGPGWFNLPAPKMTEELKNDLDVLKMRSVMDPKHFYKKNDMEVLPKYFQVGRIMDSPLDHVNERLTRKQRKRTMVDELLADAEFQKYNKRKYKEIIEEKKKTEYRTFMKDKRQKSKTELKKNKSKVKRKEETNKSKVKRQEKKKKTEYISFMKDKRQKNKTKL